MKYVGLVLLILATTAFGWYKSHCLRSRVKLMDGMMRLCGYISSQIRYSGAPVSEILEKASQSDGFGKLPVLQHLDGGNCWREVWLDNLKSDLSDWGAANQDLELMREFSSLLGTTDREGQEQHCEMYEKLFQTQCEEAKAAASRLGRLYIVLGASAGCALALLLF